FTQPIDVRKDPNSHGTEGDIAQQTVVLLELRDALNDIVEMTNTIEMVRSQLQSLKATLSDNEGATAVIAAAAELEDKLVELEGEFIQLKLTGRGQDAIRWPGMLGRQISYLAGKISMTDFVPTDQQMEVKQVIEEELAVHRTTYEVLISSDVAQFNQLLLQEGYQGVILP
ncbi:MAG: hypothetical protein JSW51_06940, partial [Gemmatimonadota bacterium]